MAWVAENGTFGQSVPAIPLANTIEGRGPALLVGVRSSSSYRSNVGLVNLGPGAVVFTWEVLDADGTVVASSDRRFEPFESRQVNGFVPDGVENGVVRVFAGDESARWTAYASVVDNFTHDPVLLLPADVVAEPQIIVAAAHTRGRNGTFWTTDLVIHNPGAAAVACRVEYSDEVGTGFSDLVIAAGHTASVEDIVATIFERTGVGVIRVTPSTGAVAVTGRTSTPDAQGGGFGQLVRPQPDGAALWAHQEAYLVGIAGAADPDEGFRTNLGVANLSSITISPVFEIRSSRGELLRTRRLTVAPRSHGQISAGRCGPDDAPCWATVSCDDPNARYMAYASTVDNRSGDPVHRPALLAIN